MPRNAKPAKRANRSNPRVDRNPHRRIDDTREDFGVQARPGKRKYRDQSSSHGDTGFEPAKANKIELLPRNLAQEEYLDALADQQNAIIFAMGPAGTGKTMLATLYALSQLQAGEISKIVITRPAVSVDEQHGFLPGDLLQKMAPWVIPIMDVIKEVYPLRALEKMLQDEVIEVAPLAYMRGRTLKNAVVIADEMQNATPSQMKMLLTRIGENSRMIVTGDLRQHDRGFESNGLKDFVARLDIAGSNRIEVCEFDARDVERHPVIEDVLRIYGD